MFDTIVAISSGLVNQPISIIRLSGPDSYKIVQKIFTGKIGEKNSFTHGYIKDGDVKIDEVIVLWYKDPNSFTGQDLVEINAHGGVVVTNMILQLLLENGARIANPGEFSFRAFINNKIDLVKAEAIHDLIFAKTNEQVKFSVKKFDHQTSKMIKDLEDKLLFLIATIETNIDYPEYDDVEQLTHKKLIPKLEELKNNMDEIVLSSESSKYIFEGINVAIVGKPNVGKSSLLNYILNEDKAIVSDIPGTTRDVVEGSIKIGQILFRFVDTAGIRKTNEKIEKIGISKTLIQINEADLILHLVSSNSKEEHKDDMEIMEHFKNKNVLQVFTKSDLLKVSDKNKNIYISIKNNDIDNLLQKINNVYPNINFLNDKIITNSRQLTLIKKALNSTTKAIESLKNQITPDVVILDIRSAWKDISNILGKADYENLLDKMFSNFCLGK